MILPISADQFPGVVVIYVFLFLSTVALLSVLVRVLSLAIAHHIRSSRGREPAPISRECVFFGSQLGYYAACLLIANLFNAIAGLMGMPWLIEGQINEGPLCSAQAAMMQFGNTSSGYFTAAIAVHTFTSLVLRRRQSGLTSSLYIAFGWIQAALIAFIPGYIFHPSGPSSGLYGISGLSCGVKTIYPFYIFVFHLLPIFISSFFSAVLYSLIFLALRGTLRIRGGVRLLLNPEERENSPNTDSENYQLFVASLARTMLWFPICYIALLVPYSVMRLLMSSRLSVPFPVMVLAYCLWFLISILNVIIVYMTFRVLTPAMDGKIRTTTTSANHRRDMESFGEGVGKRNLTNEKPLRFSIVTSGLPPLPPVPAAPGPSRYSYGGKANFLAGMEPMDRVRPNGISTPQQQTVHYPVGHFRSMSATSQDSVSSGRGLISGAAPFGSVGGVVDPSRMATKPMTSKTNFHHSPGPSPTSFISLSPPPTTTRVMHSRNSSTASSPTSPSLPPPKRRSSLNHYNPHHRRGSSGASGASIRALQQQTDVAGWLNQHVEQQQEWDQNNRGEILVGGGGSSSPTTMTTTTTPMMALRLSAVRE